MATRTKVTENKSANGEGVIDVSKLESPWVRAFKRQTDWPDKDEFLDVIYWARQFFGIAAGIVWGLIPLKGFMALSLFLLLNAAVVYMYCSSFQKIDEEEYGGVWELTKEGFMTSFAGFLMTWIIVYTGVHVEIAKDVYVNK